jgi:hypothetical protein
LRENYFVKSTFIVKFSIWEILMCNVWVLQNTIYQDIYEHLVSCMTIIRFITYSWTEMGQIILNIRF